MPDLSGKCPKCGKPVVVEENPANVVFVVDDEAVRACPKCGTTLIYGEVLGMEIHVEPPQ